MLYYTGYGYGYGMGLYLYIYIYGYIYVYTLSASALWEPTQQSQNDTKNIKKMKSWGDKCEVKCCSLNLCTQIHRYSILEQQPLGGTTPKATPKPTQPPTETDKSTNTI